jgi:Fe-S-cluster formation regulator IscX/YfhJ
MEGPKKVESSSLKVLSQIREIEEHIDQNVEQILAAFLKAWIDENEQKKDVS